MSMMWRAPNILHAGRGLYSFTLELNLSNSDTLMRYVGLCGGQKCSS